MTKRHFVLSSKWLVLFPGLLAALLLFVPVATAIAQGQPERVPVIIGFDKTPGAAQRAMVRGLGGRIKHSYHLIPAIAASIPENAINALVKQKGVKLVEPDGTFQASDLELDNTWGVKRIGSGAVHDGGNQGINDLGVRVKVAVIDSGVDHTHPEFIGIYMGGYDFVNNDSDPMDDNSHGTHVCGTICAANDDSGVVGVAPQVELYALKILDANGSGSFSNAIAALQWCVDNGMQVTNNSYGSSGNPGGSVEAAFNAAEAAGIINIAAAGNTGRRNGKGNTVGYPARYASVVAVAATDSSDKRASFSSTGDTVELAAPGVGILSTVPGGGYASFNGTSMASPHVAGSAALIIAAGITAVDDIRAAMALTAEDLGATGLDPKYGWGLVDVAAAVGTLPSDDPSGDPPGEEATSVVVDSISYVGSGGKKRDKNLVVTVALLNDLGDPVAGASVSVELNLDSGSSWTATGTTGDNGLVSYSLKNAPSGTYDTVVTDISAAGLSWDGVTPGNSHTK